MITIKFIYQEISNSLPYLNNIKDLLQTNNNQEDGKIDRVSLT